MATLLAVPVLALLFALPVGPLGAVELTLDSVTAGEGPGETRLRLDSKASFNFDPGSGVLTSSGSWTAQYVLPNQLTRFSHKVEDFRASAGGGIAVRSYECVEGTFGAPLLGANLCGNYRFGPNGVDDGGVADDVVVAAPKALPLYRIGSLDWDGLSLQLTLIADGLADADLFPEQSLTLRLRVKPERVAR